MKQMAKAFMATRATETRETNGRRMGYDAEMRDNPNMRSERRYEGGNDMRMGWDMNERRMDQGGARGSYEGAYGNRDRYGNSYGEMEHYGGMENHRTIEYGPESRSRDRRGREHYDNGRYAPMRNQLERDYHDEQRHIPDDHGAPMDARQNRVKMGFQEPESGHNVLDFPGGELSDEDAVMWTERMKNSDGSTGPHFSREQARQMMQQKKLDADPTKFWVTLNMIYSDFCGAAKKLGVNTPDFYAAMADAWLNDKDAVENKLAAYYRHVVKR